MKIETDYEVARFKNDAELTHYFRTGKSTHKERVYQVSNSDGGYLLPEKVITIKRRGIVGWLFRLIHNKRGWKDVDFYKMLMDDRYWSISRRNCQK